MKLRVWMILLTAALLLTGCGAGERSAPAAPARTVPAAPVQQAPATPTQIAPAQQTPAAPAQTQPAAQQLTPAEAEAIALAHAGFSADQVTRLRTEYDIDDGVPQYEVEFRVDRWEYDYEIHALTGAVLSFDKDD